ncbi:MAG: hypothetical protein IJ244_06165 [Bacteroidaceae bacterium]|nr:hypothetical protein [Bacteroidaceae bacterium]
MEQTTPHWEKNILLIDADYADRLVFDISVQLERMLERRMPKVDLTHWIDYLALDGGLRPGKNSTQVLFIYEKQKALLDNLLPASLPDELNGRSFSDNLGEFLCAASPVEEEVVNKGELYAQNLEVLLKSKDTERILLLPDVESYGGALKTVLQQADREKDILLFASMPLSGFMCRQEIVTYSLMAALGVSSDELPLS